MNLHGVALTEWHAPFSGRDNERLVNLVDEFRVHSTSSLGSPPLGVGTRMSVPWPKRLPGVPLLVWEHDRPELKEAKSPPPLVIESPCAGPVSEDAALRCG